MFIKLVSMERKIGILKGVWNWINLLLISFMNMIVEAMCNKNIANSQKLHKKSRTETKQTLKTPEWTRQNITNKELRSSVGNDFENLKTLWHGKQNIFYAHLKNSPNFMKSAREMITKLSQWDMYCSNPLIVVFFLYTMRSRGTNPKKQKVTHMANNSSINRTQYSKYHFIVICWRKIFKSLIWRCLIYQWTEWWLDGIEATL